MLLLKDSSEEEQLRLDLAFVKTVVFPAAQPSSISTHQCFLICAHVSIVQSAVDLAFGIKHGNCVM